MIVLDIFQHFVFNKIYMIRRSVASNIFQHLKFQNFKYIPIITIPLVTTRKHVLPIRSISGKITTSVRVTSKDVVKKSILETKSNNFTLFNGLTDLFPKKKKVIMCKNSVWECITIMFIFINLYLFFKDPLIDFLNGVIGIFLILVLYF